jgi:hypothetical protein
LLVAEPAGLDARAAAIVMRAVRNVALSGRTVMVTIHQPSIEIFEAFDMLLLLQVSYCCVQHQRVLLCLDPLCYQPGLHCVGVQWLGVYSKWWRLHALCKDCSA